MAKAFSVASWNVEHFKNEGSKVDRVVEFLDEQNPDVFALYEVEGAEVFSELTTRMPGYSFHITEGPQTQEILVGASNKLTSFFTQKLEFKAGNQFLRPGALLTVTVVGQNYSLLFLHTKSSNAPVGLGLRDDMFRRALKFKATLDKAVKAQTGSNKPANYVFLGDLNTMGMKYLFQRSIDATTELRKLDSDAKKRGMRRLKKTHPATWSNGSASSIPDSDLDQVVIATQLKLKSFGQDASGNPVEVDVRGWVDQGTAALKDKWIREHSDHSLLFFQVEK
jgi:exonuclease III